ncbi:hypothetical protein AWZ03_014698 [Drosophila navojoa]|uniref:Uncharacterized protein n=1 Tax=Drosophila navojoa TaxID=7232 RepID=A0A484ASN2_DRONA|nr:hypothetical protein AWZ03_014698 [Drosophila navojoa]
MVADCGPMTFAVGNCDTTVSTTFCKRLRKASCAQQLVSGTVAQCAIRPGHSEPITTVRDGIIIINIATRMETIPPQNKESPEDGLQPTRGRVNTRTEELLMEQLHRMPLRKNRKQNLTSPRLGGLIVANTRTAGAADKAIGPDIV